jgi:prolyl oligopeptidase
MSAGWARGGPARGASLALAAGLLLACGGPGEIDDSDTAGYPQARREARVTVFHDIQVGDPYRWLENASATETRDWLRAQQRLARSRLNRREPDDQFAPLLTELRAAVQAGVPQLANGRYAYRRTDGSSGTSEIWLTLDTGEPGRPLVAATALPGAGELGSFMLSPDGALLAWSFRPADEAAWRWRIRDAQTGQDAETELVTAEDSSISWSADSRGIFYIREPAATRDGGSLSLGIWYHRAGTAQGRDVQVYAGSMNTGVRASTRVTDDGRYLLIEFAAEGTSATAIHYQRLGRTPARGRTIPLLDRWDGRYLFVGSTERTFYLLTTAGAPHGRLVAIDLDRTDPGDWRIVVPEGEFPLDQALLVGGRLGLVYREPGQSRLYIHDLAGQLVREVELPGAGFAGALSGSYADTELRYAWTDLRQPPASWRHDVNSGAGGSLSLAPPPVVQPAVRIDRLDASGSGAPLTLVRPESAATGALLLTLVAESPGRLPSWQPEALAWAVAGGTWAQFEPGPEPARAVDQLLATLAWLEAQALVPAGPVAVEASGHGATIAAAAINRRPELFAAALLADAPLDLLRADPAGAGWADPADPAGFAALHALSPYHQVMPGQCYPSILLRAVPGRGKQPQWQAWKYLAALQSAQACDRSLLWVGRDELDAWRLLARKAGLHAPRGSD